MNKETKKQAMELASAHGKLLGGMSVINKYIQRIIDLEQKDLWIKDNELVNELQHVAEYAQEMIKETDIYDCEK